MVTLTMKIIWRAKKLGMNLTWTYGWLLQSLFEKRKDVLLLADKLFERFIDTCFKFCKLDPCHYFHSPGLSWDAMLKMTGEKLEKIFDIEM